MSVPRNIYDFIIEPIRLMDKREGREFLKRYLLGPQDVWTQLDENLFLIPSIWSIEDCPDRLLQYLKNIVGWTSELDEITRDLTPIELRRLIAISAMIWKERGSETALQDIVFALTAAKTRIWDWFDFRWLIGEAAFDESRLGEDSWIVDFPREDYIPGSESSSYLSNLRIVDDGDLNKALLLNLIRLMRATGEQWEVTYLSFLDLFDIPGDFNLWTIDNVEELTVADNMLTFGLEGEETYTENVRNLGLQQGSYTVKARVKSPGDEIDLYWIDDEGEPLYVAWIFPGRRNTPGYLYFARYLEGSEDTLVDVELFDFPLALDRWYTYRLTMTDEVDGRVRLQFFIDGNELFDVVDDQFVPEGGGGEPEPPTYETWEEERPAGDVDCYWSALGAGGDTTPTVLAVTDGYEDDNGGVYIGRKVGETFVWSLLEPTGEPYEGYWISAAVGYDGATLIVNEYESYPWVSTDGGLNFEQQEWDTGEEDWIFSLGGDSETVHGIKLRTAGGGAPWLSPDLGDNWSESSGPSSNGSFFWLWCASARDPDVLAACYSGSESRAYFTDDGWDTYTELAPFGDIEGGFISIAMGGDDNSIAILTRGGYVLFTPDRGASWQIATPFKIYAYTVAMLPDSETLFLGSYEGRIWRADVTLAAPFTGLPIGKGDWGGLKPYGLASIPQWYQSISVSYDGSVVCVGAYESESKISLDGGVTWPNVGDTSTNLFVGGDNDKIFCVQNGNSCKVSYNGGVDWETIAVAGRYSESWSGGAVGRNPDVMAATILWTDDAYMTIDDWDTYITLISPLEYPNWGGVALGGDDQMVALSNTGGGQVVLSPNRGSTWTTFVPPSWPTGPLAISQDCLTLYVATYEGIYSIPTAGGEWARLTPTGDFYPEIYGIGVGGDTGEQILVTCSPHLGAFMNPAPTVSADGSFAWSEITTPFTGGGGG